jgi:hypothetical protein
LAPASVFRGADHRRLLSAGRGAFCGAGKFSGTHVRHAPGFAPPRPVLPVSVTMVSKAVVRGLASGPDRPTQHGHPGFAAVVLAVPVSPIARRAEEEEPLAPVTAAFPEKLELLHPSADENSTAGTVGRILVAEITRLHPLGDLVAPGSPVSSFSESLRPVLPTSQFLARCPATPRRRASARFARSGAGRRLRLSTCCGSQLPFTAGNGYVSASFNA